MYKTFIIPYLSEAQHVSGDTPPIIKSLKLHWQPLVFHMYKVVGRVVGPPITHPTTFHVWKTRGCQYNFRLLMMGGVSPETCWASDKYWIIKFRYIVASCWIFLYESYYAARIHEHQIYRPVQYVNMLTCVRCDKEKPKGNPTCDRNLKHRKFSILDRFLLNRHTVT